MTRRDDCYVNGRRMKTLNRDQAALAWHALAIQMEEFGAKDIPKFRDLLRAVRVATIVGKREKSA